MRDDPFAKLGALDQKLFAGTPHQPASHLVAKPESSDVPKGADQESLEPRNQGKKEGRNQGSLEPRTGKLTGQLEDEPPSPRFDINHRPDRQNTYAFTGRELDGLEDLKILIRRRFDLNVTKNDLVRCAVHTLLEDFEQRGEGSSVLRRLRKKKDR